MRIVTLFSTVTLLHPLLVSVLLDRQTNCLNEGFYIDVVVSMDEQFEVEICQTADGQNTSHTARTKCRHSFSIVPVTPTLQPDLFFQPTE